MNETSKMSEQWMETAACEALGANSAEESSIYHRDLPDAGREARGADREMHETVSLLSTASPYMAPPADLRGRILQATAPATFKMEDYRKATQDNGKFYRWGFYAAMFFLMAGAYYNLSTKSALTQASQQLVTMNEQLNLRDAAMKQRDIALAAFIDPKSQPVKLFRDGQDFGRALLNQANHTAVLVLPSEIAAQGQLPMFRVLENNQPVNYQTVLITAPAKELNFQVPEGSIMQALQNPKTIEPDSSLRPLVAHY